MRRVAGWIDDVLRDPSETAIARVHADVLDMAQAFPLYAAPAGVA
jgi:glycine/serine hydroxymethyltransferase